MDDKLTAIYTDASSPGSLGGVDRLYRESKKQKIKGVTKKKVKNYLKKHLGYTLHKPVKRKFVRGVTSVFYIDELWQADLCEMQLIREYNSDVRYLLTVIDVFSKYAWVRQLKNKRTKTVADAFVDIVDTSKRKPHHLQTDKGSEFISRIFQDELKELEINFYTTDSENKASVVERFNRTLKSRIWRYFTLKNTFKYTDILDDILLSYNNTKHSGIGNREPSSVDYGNQLRVWREKFIKNTQIKFKYKVGDHVRISKNKGLFEKGYYANWTEEYFIISERLARNPPVYRIKDLNNEDITGIFYEEELQSVTTPPDFKYPIAKIIKKKKNKVFVQWRGWPNSFNTWVPAGEVHNYG
jgi:transposase InsO family protein